MIATPVASLWSLRHLTSVVRQIQIEKIWYDINMKVSRDKARLKKMSKIDDAFVAVSPQKCIAFIWELTAELWSLRESPYVERRQQKNVTNIIKQ